MRFFDFNKSNKTYIKTNIINLILYYYNIQKKSAWTSIIEKALLDMSTIDILNYIWSETIGSLEDVLELAEDEDSQKKVLKITNQQVGWFNCSHINSYDLTRF